MTQRPDCDWQMRQNGRRPLLGIRLGNGGHSCRPDGLLAGDCKPRPGAPGSDWPQIDCGYIVDNGRTPDDPGDTY